MPEVLSPSTSTGSLIEWRFVPSNWHSPFPHHKWYIYASVEEMGGVSELYATWMEKLKKCPPVTWYLPDGTKYTAPVDFDGRDRPLLAKVWGFR